MQLLLLSHAEQAELQATQQRSAGPSLRVTAQLSRHYSWYLLTQRAVPARGGLAWRAVSPAAVQGGSKRWVGKDLAGGGRGWVLRAASFCVLLRLSCAPIF